MTKTQCMRVPQHHLNQPCEDRLVIIGKKRWMCSSCYYVYKYDSHQICSPLTRLVCRKTHHLPVNNPMPIVQLLRSARLMKVHNQLPGFVFLSNVFWQILLLQLNDHHIKRCIIALRCCHMSHTTDMTSTDSPCLSPLTANYMKLKGT